MEAHSNVHLPSPISQILDRLDYANCTERLSRSDLLPSDTTGLVPTLFLLTPAPQTLHIIKLVTETPRYALIHLHPDMGQPSGAPANGFVAVARKVYNPLVSHTGAINVRKQAQ